MSHTECSNCLRAFIENRGSTNVTGLPRARSITHENLCTTCGIDALVWETGGDALAFSFRLAEAVKRTTGRNDVCVTDRTVMYAGRVIAKRMAVAS